MEALALQPTFDFTLSAHNHARRPPAVRDKVRLLVTRGLGAPAVHAEFRDLPDFLAAGDLLVVNDSATLPAALPAQDAEGRALTLHLSTRRGGDRWIVEPRGRQSRAGETLFLPAGATAHLQAPYRDSRRLWLARLDLGADPLAFIHAWGRPIRYDYVTEAFPLDDYQTIFARRPGSAEMPSAGRPFSERVLRDVAARGVRIATVTLHTGVSSLEGHETPYEESFAVSEATAWMVNGTRRWGGRVIAVGTTVVRALESAVQGSRVVATAGWTDRLITPEAGPRVVDGLLSGFHEPTASHLRMLEAFMGRDRLVAAYAAALREGYRWHEFGDSHLIV